MSGIQLDEEFFKLKESNEVIKKGQNSNFGGFI